MDRQKVGVFFGELDDGAMKALSVDSLMKNLAKDPDIFTAKVARPFDHEGQMTIKRYCDSEDLTVAVVCNSRGLNFTERPLLVDNGSKVTIPIIPVNILERCSWIHPDKNEAEQKAERILRIAVARARRARPIALSTRPANRKVMVLGGNHAACQMAEGLADAGLAVILVKTPAPSGCFFPLPEQLMKKVNEDSRIEIIEGAVVRAVNGQVGDFYIALEQGGLLTGRNVGAVIVAIDARIDEDSVLKGPGRIGLREFMLSTEESVSDRVAVLLDRTGPERRCAAEVAVQSAKLHVEKGGQVYFLFRNMPVYGKHGQKIYDDARAAGVQFLRYDEISPEIEESSGELQVSIVDSIVPDRKYRFSVDRLVTAGKVVPRVENQALTKLLRQPLDVEGFLQPGNIRHLPVESGRKGVLFAGGCHSDCDPFESRYESNAVTAKVLSILPEGDIIAPVEVVSVDVGKCASCLSCLRLCPHGAIEAYHNEKSVTILSGACWECGICAAACPGQAIEHGGLSRGQMADALSEATIELGGRQPFIVFACQQSAVPSLDSAGRLGLTVPFEATFIEVPCAGRVDENTMLKALEDGASRVLVMGCHPQVCRSLKGNIVAAKRVKRVQEMLSQSGMDPEMIQYHSIANNEPYRLVKLLNHVDRKSVV